METERGKNIEIILRGVQGRGCRRINAYTRVLHPSYRFSEIQNMVRMTRLVPFERVEERLVRVISLPVLSLQTDLTFNYRE